MLNVIIPATEIYDSKKNEFIQIQEQELCFEHSLVSVSLWESKWHKPFLKPDYKFTNEEMLSYIECMCLTTNVDRNAFRYLPSEIINKIKEYINDPMTATVVTTYGSKKNNKMKFTTSEELYYMMFTCNIPKECETWHINRLLKLIEVFSAKNGSTDKLSNSEIMRNNSLLNAKRKAALHSKG